jgi:hypothetical protein
MVGSLVTVTVCNNQNFERSDTQINKVTFIYLILRNLEGGFGSHVKPLPQYLHIALTTRKFRSMPGYSVIVPR